MYRLAYITKNGEVKSQNFDTENMVYDFLLPIIEDIKAYKIIDKSSGEIVDKKI